MNNMSASQIIAGLMATHPDYATSRQKDIIDFGEETLSSGIILSNFALVFHRHAHKGGSALTKPAADFVEKVLANIDGDVANEFGVMFIESLANLSGWDDDKGETVFMQLGPEARRLCEEWLNLDW
jgi:hypothetical protein